MSFISPALLQQLPSNVSVLLTGAGGSAPIIGFSQPLSSLGPQRPPVSENLLPPAGLILPPPQQNELLRLPVPPSLLQSVPPPVLQTIPAPPNSPASPSPAVDAGPGRGKNKNKIPPGIAKKESGALPAGNPWKAVLQSKEQSQPSLMNPPQPMPLIQSMLLPAPLPQGGSPVPVILQPNVMPNPSFINAFIQPGPTIATALPPTIPQRGLPGL